VIRLRSWGSIAWLLLIAAVLAVTGCSGSASSKPGDLSEEHKRQLRELDEQRQQEWGQKKK
jgi:hypothetical protein